MKLEFPEGNPGIHPPIAALKKILQANNVHNPLSGEPYTEAMLLGLGGGLDIGCILFQFKHLPHPMLVLGFRNHWNQPRAFLENVSDRLGANVNFFEYDDPGEAQDALQTALKQGKTPIVWVDKSSLPYHELPDSLKGLNNHQVAVVSRDARLWRLYLDDLSKSPIEIREKDFTSARANLGQNNFLMMVFNQAPELNTRELRESVIQGIRECTAQLTNPMRTSGISVLETWSVNLVNRSNQQGWSQIFPNHKGLFPVLKTLYESIKLNGTEGFALRKLYSDFLHETASYMGNPGLNAVAGQYLQLSNHWSSLAESALPSKVPEFDKVKSLLNQKYAAYRNNDFISYQQSLADLALLEASIGADCPLDSGETKQLFDRLSGQIKLIAELELSAALRLRDESRT